MPPWLPNPAFLGNLIAVIFIAAGLSIISGIGGTFGAGFLGAMFLLWVVIVHVPRIALALYDGNEWSNAFVALAMAGGAFLVAGSFDMSRQSKRSQQSTAHSHS